MIKIKRGLNEDYDKKYPVKMNLGFFVPIILLAAFGLYTLFTI